MFWDTGNNVIAVGKIKRPIHLCSVQVSQTTELVRVLVSAWADLRNKLPGTYFRSFLALPLSPWSAMFICPFGNRAGAQLTPVCSLHLTDSLQL